MPCDCEKQEAKHNGDDNGDKPKDCPEGQKFDKDAGKCVPVGNGKEPKKEQADGNPSSDSTLQELPEGDPGEISQTKPETCPEGHSFNAKTSLCEPTDQKDPGIGQTQGSSDAASTTEHSLQILNKKIDMLSKAKTEKIPTAKIGDDSNTKVLSMEGIAKEMIEALGEGRNFVFHIPLDVLRSINVGPADPKYGISEAYRTKALSFGEAIKKPNKTLKELFTISGTHATQDIDSDVAIIPGAISFIPVFQFAKVKQIAQGMDRARFFTATLPTPIDQTAGTTATEGTSNISAIEVVPSQISGNYIIADYDLIENSPFDFLQTIVETSAASYDDYVANDMLTVVTAEGTLTPGLWIDAESGATITSSDLSTTQFDETGVFFGREYLENQGYLRGGVKPVLALHPKQWRELMSSTNVTSLATRSVPDIWLKAQLEEFGGVQIVVTNAVEAVNNASTDAFNAYMFVPKHSFGIAVKRDVTVKFHDIGEDNTVRVNTSWRTKTGILDATSIVRISSTQ